LREDLSLHQVYSLEDQDLSLVYLWRIGGRQYSPSELVAELPDGTRMPAILDLGGQRYTFGHPLPSGTWILLHGKRVWGPLGADHRLVEARLA
jgi:hypothetical protein